MSEPVYFQCPACGVTSLFSRLQKLNKEATPAPWYEPGVYQGIRHLDRNCEWYFEQLEDAPEGANLPQREDAALIVECRNSLPAVLNLIEAAQWATSHVARGTPPTNAEAALMKAVAVFVTPEGDRSTMSGQEAGGQKEPT